MERPAEAAPYRYVAPPAANPGTPTAVLLVTGYTRAGLSMLREIAQTFAGHYRKVVFLSLVAPEAAEPDALERQRSRAEDELEHYVPQARLLGLDAEGRCALGFMELGSACRGILAAHPRACFVLTRAWLPGAGIGSWILPEEPMEKIRAEFLRTRIPFFEMAVSLPPDPT